MATPDPEQGKYVEGRWLVTTLNSTYLLDLDEATVTRNVGESGRPILGDGDGEPIPLREVFHLAVGERMRITAQLGEYEDILNTSTVQSIDRWEAQA